MSTTSMQFFFETKTFSKDCCIYWGIVWQGNVTFSSRNVPSWIRNVSLFSMDHCKKESTLQLFSGSINVLNECRIDEENVLVEVTQSFFFQGPHIDVACWVHVPRNIVAPWKSLAKYCCIYSRMLLLNTVLFNLFTEKICTISRNASLCILKYCKKWC